jgi:hypothetical protein
MSAPSQSRSFGIRDSDTLERKLELRRTADLGSRRAEIERKAARRKLMWDWAMHLAQSGRFADAAAVEAELQAMGFTEATDLLTEQDRRDIESQLPRVSTG